MKASLIWSHVQVQVTGTACGPPSTLVQVKKQKTHIEQDSLFILL